jgi:SpoVK/Ycf46/Vps4 family AAA+-type ATPase
MNMDVYRIELSSVVSKYIGETEKNLETIFQQAENRQWILFFDEADALFGKRSDTQSSNDRHANQEVAYLLQRIEEFPGVVILATNLKSNIDDAFLRRFQSMIFFPVPDPLQRQILWEKALNKSEYVASEVDVKELSKSYELAGGSIINVIRYAAIASLRNGSQLITQKDLLAGVAKEQRKQGRII